MTGLGSNPLQRSIFANRKNFGNDNGEGLGLADNVHPHFGLRFDTQARNEDSQGVGLIGENGFKMPRISFGGRSQMIHPPSVFDLSPPNFREIYDCGDNGGGEDGMNGELNGNRDNPDMLNQFVKGFNFRRKSDK